MSRRRRVPQLPAILTKSPLPQRISSVCVACGGRSLVHFAARSQQVQCRSCGLVSPDFNQRKAPTGYANEQVNPLNRNQVNELVDEMLDALSHEHVKRKLQALQKQAHGDVPLLCHSYVPFVVDICAMVASKFGFSASVEGVKESLRVLQRYATTEDDSQLTLKLIRLRRELTPTGAWITEDAAAEADDLKKKADELDRQRRQQEETQRMEDIAAENTKKARLRTKKIALGLDPSVPRLPALELEPPPVVVAHPDANVQLRVVVRYALQCQWFFQGKALDEGDVMYTGAHRSTLTVRRLTKRCVGDYYCVCTNEEGVVSSQTTRVEMLTTLRSQRLATRKLKTVPLGSIVPLDLKNALPTAKTSTSASATPRLIALCISGVLHLLHAETLVPAKTAPPLVVPTGARVTAVAWHPSTNNLAVATTARVCELTMYMINMPRLLPAPSSTNLKSAAKTPANAPPPVFLIRQVAACTLPYSVSLMRFLGGGQSLVISDLHSVLGVYDVTPSSLVYKQSIRSDDPYHPLSHIDVTSPVSSLQKNSFAGIAVCRRNCSFVELLNTDDGQSTKLAFSFPVHRVVFDRNGFTLAVAESGGLKSWVSIVSITANSMSSKRGTRFVAHVGKLSGMQWTAQSALLFTSGYDGYVKMWDLERSGDEVACVFRAHVDFRGVHSLALLEGNNPFAWVAAGCSDCRLHVCALPLLHAFEENRLVDQNRAVSHIQAIAKGKQTRDLINKFIRPTV